MAFADRFRSVESLDVDSEFAERVKRLSGCNWPPENSAELTLILTRAGFPLPRIEQLLAASAAEGFEGVGELPAGYVSSGKDDWPTFSAAMIAGLERYKRESAASKAHGDTGANSPEAAYSPDFRSVRWYGVEHSFTTAQARVVETLWIAWGQGTPDVGDETLLNAVDHESPPTSVRHLFRAHSAWGTMIVAGRTKGSHRLVEPEKNS